MNIKLLSLLKILGPKRAGGHIDFSLESTLTCDELDQLKELLGMLTSAVGNTDLERNVSQQHDRATGGSEEKKRA